MTSTTTGRLAVLGGGVIGLSSAWRAASAGWQVTLLDPAPGSGASWVAGGMLAPVTEAWPGEEDLLALGVDSVGRWPGFAAELDAAAGRPAGLRTEGTVVAATGSGDRAELDALAAHLERLGRPTERLSGRELRRLEPAIGPDVRGGLSVPGDLAVDNRMLLAALRAAGEKAGVTFEARSARRVREDGGRVAGVCCAEGPDVDADVVLVCAGAYSSALHPTLEGLIRPVKGEILRLARRTGAFPPPRRTVRALVDGRPVYAVPRDGDGLVVGATQAETGFDTEVTVAGVRDLLRDIERVLPGVAEYALLEAAAGLRPGSPDNLPLIGAPGPDGLLVATGHHRNGMLLAPVTADAVLALLRGEPVPESVRAADAARFVAARSGTGR
ncbi:glycine oxidase ThiO [Pseudonocardia acidicola]|uniref:glycine oxidase n=1 Tax=Pseudonocardia acidicola TaxID=2724939 RepID=A0ABX1SK81_9PSEU|nr:glycine oxidase ThiO [Pseudonocardia acidicola]NMI01937.1 glycine oxidase ThiO [Pseudonocardia acidicola]